MKKVLYILLILLCITKVYSYYHIEELKGDIDGFYEHVDDFVMKYQSKCETYYHVINKLAEQDTSLIIVIRGLKSEIYNLENNLLYREDGSDINYFSLLQFNLSKFPYSKQVFEEIGDSLNKIIELKVDARFKFYKYISVFFESYIMRLGIIQEQRNLIHRKAIISKVQQISEDSIHVDLFSIVFVRDTLGGILWSAYQTEWFVNDIPIEISEVPFKIGTQENFTNYSLKYFDGLTKRTRRYAPK